MKKTGLLVIAILILVSCNQNVNRSGAGNPDRITAEISAPVKDGVFIHITESYNDPHRVLMPLKMAVLMSTDKDVIVYLDIHAVEMLVKGARDMTYADFESFQTYIAQLTRKGGWSLCLPHLLERYAGYESERYLSGGCPGGTEG